ncbi:hypothetical protein DFR49_2365 [Hephaestia caeni]|uniref:Uncharacterized protein n=1 Tax=Hephaestia caeni TaxID=645617 RepID=A0A397PAC5_9SPHN|nr:hypothetical protein DFR49_2365 [Hephaestia caeni]
MTYAGSRGEALGSPRAVWARHACRPPQASSRRARTPGETLGITTHVYGRKLDFVTHTPGAGLAADCRCGPLLRLASFHNAPERPGGSQEGHLYLLEARQRSPAFFGHWNNCSPRPAVRFCLANGDPRRDRGRGGLSFGKVSSGHPTHPSSVLFGTGFVARTCDLEAGLPTLPREGRRIADDPSAAGDHDLPLFASGRSTSLRRCSANSRQVTAGGKCRRPPYSTSSPAWRHRHRRCRHHEVRAFDLARTSPMNMG